MDIKWKSLNSPLLRKRMPLVGFVSLFLMLVSLAYSYRYSLNMDYLNEDSFNSSYLLRSKMRIANEMLSDIANRHLMETGLFNSSIDDFSLSQSDIDYYVRDVAEMALWESGYYYDDYNDLFFHDYGAPVGLNTPIRLHNGLVFYPGQNLENLLVFYSENRFEYESDYQEIVQTKLEQHMAQAAVSEDVGEATETTAPTTAETIEETVVNGIPSYDFEEFKSTFMEEALASVAAARIDEYRNLVNNIEAVDGLVYYIHTKGATLGNIDDYEDIEALPAYSIYSRYDSKSNVAHYSPDEVVRYGSDVIIAFGFDDSYYYAVYQDWQAVKTMSLIFLPLLAAATVVFLLSYGYILYYTGKPYVLVYEGENSNGPKEILPPARKGFIYSDLAVIGIIIAFFVGILINGYAGTYTYWELSSYTGFSRPGLLNIVGILLSAFIASTIITGLLYSLIWDFKGKRLFSHSVIGVCLGFISKTMMNLSNLFNWGYRLISVRKINKVKQGIERIKGGDFSTAVNIKGYGHMAVIAAGLNEISAGFNIAVENRIKSERLKTELISNVSHDIRTPLTSIVTYVDLLKKEGNSEEETQHYLEVLESKTARLKSLIDDLFEASKASSGNISTELMPIDIGNVLEQAMGELEDKLASSGLDFRVSKPDAAGKMMAIADGKLLWRVINNLFSNIFKYSMPGSRVYIDIQGDSQFVSVTFKNMSAYELNITADELMERFTRGDQSRSSEGSGLGLNIANSLVNLMNGEFKLDLDGDLFKATIKLERGPEPPVTGTAEPISEPEDKPLAN